MEKGEIAQVEQFHLFPGCFPKAFFFNVLKRVKFYTERHNAQRERHLQTANQMGFKRQNTFAKGKKKRHGKRRDNSGYKNLFLICFWILG